MWEIKQRMTPQKTSGMLLGLEQFTRATVLQVIIIIIVENK